MSLDPDNNSQPISPSDWVKYLTLLVDAREELILSRLLANFPTYPVPDDILQRLLCQSPKFLQAAHKRLDTLHAQIKDVILRYWNQNQQDELQNPRYKYKYTGINQVVEYILINYPNTITILQQPIENDGLYPHGLTFLDFALEQCVPWGGLIYELGGAHFTPNRLVSFNHLNWADPINQLMVEIYQEWASPTLGSSSTRHDLSDKIDYNNFTQTLKQCQKLIKKSPINWFWTEIPSEERFNINSILHCGGISDVCFWVNCFECQRYPLKLLPDGSYKSPFGGSHIFPQILVPESVGSVGSVESTESKNSFSKRERQMSAKNEKGSKTPQNLVNKASNDTNLIDKAQTLRLGVMTDTSQPPDGPVRRCFDDDHGVMIIENSKNIDSSMSLHNNKGNSNDNMNVCDVKGIVGDGEGSVKNNKRNIDRRIIKQHRHVIAPKDYRISKDTISSNTYTEMTPLFLCLHQDIVQGNHILPIMTMQLLSSSSTSSLSLFDDTTITPTIPRSCGSRPNVNLKMYPCQHQPPVMMNLTIIMSNKPEIIPPFSLTPITFILIRTDPKNLKKVSKWGGNSFQRSLADQNRWDEKNLGPFLIHMIIDTYISSLIDGFVDIEQSLIELKTYTYFDIEQELVQH